MYRLLATTSGVLNTGHNFGTVMSEAFKLKGKPESFARSLARDSIAPMIRSFLGRGIRPELTFLFRRFASCDHLPTFHLRLLFQKQHGMRITLIQLDESEKLPHAVGTHQHLEQYPLLIAHGSE